MQQIRLLHKKVDFKIKLNYEEKTLVENNRFLKLQQEDSGSDEDHKSNTSFNSGKYKTNKASDDVHHKKASELFARRRIDPYKLRVKTQR